MTPFRELSGAIARAFEKYEIYTASRFNQLDVAIANLAKISGDTRESVKTLREESVTKDHFERARKESQEGLDTIRAIVRQATAASLTKFERLENLIGNPNALHTNEKPSSVLGRMGRLECAMMELTESVSDPDAARPPVIRHEAAVNTSPVLHPTTDVGTDVLDLLPSIQLVESGVQAEIRESPLSFLGMATHTITEEMPFTSACSVQTLVPASWDPIDDDTDSLVSASSRGATSPVMPVTSPAFPSGEPSSSTGHIRRDASILDEQEIIDALVAGIEDRTQNSPPSQQSPNNDVATLTRSTISHPATLSTPARSLTPTQPHRPSAQGIPPPLRLSHHPQPPPDPPLHQGFGRPSMTAPHPVSSLSSLSLRTLSGLSSPLSSPPIIPADAATSTPRQFVPTGRVSSPSLSTMSSLSSLDSETYYRPVQHNMSASTSRATNTSISAPMKIKAERKANDRPAKRRKTTASTATFYNLAQTSHTTDRGGSGSNGKGGGKGRGRGGSASKAGRPRKNQLVITPVKTEKPKLVPQPTASTSEGTGNNAQAAEKTRYEPPRIGTDCPWPAKTGDESHREFVACDYCEGWYHFGCVGLKSGDPRLEPNAEFMCPPCETSSEIREQRRNVRYKDAACLRPDCAHPGGAEDTNEYFVERIIGRRPYSAKYDKDVSPDTDFMWLVKWDGYKADLATWAPKEHLGECARIIEEFELAAEIEGRSLDARDKLILLNEAKAVGWDLLRI